MADFSVLQAEMANQRGGGTASQASNVATEAEDEDASGFGEGFDSDGEATTSFHAASVAELIGKGVPAKYAEIAAGHFGPIISGLEEQVARLSQVRNNLFVCGTIATSF